MWWGAEKWGGSAEIPLPTLLGERITRSKWLMSIAGCGMALLALGLALLAMAPYQTCLKLARLATGSGNPLNEATFNLLAPRLVQGAVFFGVFGLALVFFRSHLARLAVKGLREARIALTWHWRAVVETIHTETRPHLIALALIVLLGTFLRVSHLNELPRYDETFTYLTFARRSLIHVFAFYPAPNNHILSTAFIWLSCRIFGPEPWAWRVPALLAGVAVLPMIYAAGRRLAGRNAGLYAAGIAAVAPPMVIYSVDARGFMLQALFLAAMLLLAAGIVEGTEGGSWSLLSAAAVAGFWTAPTMLYPYLVVMVWILACGTRKMLRPVLVSGTATGAVVAALYMPVVIVTGAEQLFRNHWVRPLPADQLWTAARSFPALLATILHAGDFVAVPILLCIGVLLSFAFSARLRRFHPNPFLILLLVLPAVAIAQRVIPFPRTLLPLLVVYYLVAAAGWAALEESLADGHEVLRAAILLTLLSGSAFYLIRSGYLESQGGFPAAKAVAGFLARELCPYDGLAISASAGPPVEYELRRAGIDPWPLEETAPDSARVLVVMAHREGPLPPPGNGLLNPFALTLEGTLEGGSRKQGLLLATSNDLFGWRRGGVRTGSAQSKRTLSCGRVRWWRCGRPMRWNIRSIGAGALTIRSKSRSRLCSTT